METYHVAILLWLTIVFILWIKFDINIFTSLFGRFGDEQDDTKIYLLNSGDYSDYSKGEALISRAKRCEHFDWQYESSWISRKNEGIGETWERNHYEQKKYGVVFKEACEIEFAKFITNYLNNKESQKQDLEKLYKLFNEYQMPTFYNDKTPHLTNILNIIFNPDFLNAPDLAKEFAIKVRDVHSASLEVALRKMKANNAASKLKKWKSEVRVMLSEVSEAQV